MTVRTAVVLKGYFNAGDQPTEANFADLIDSALGPIQVPVSGDWATPATAKTDIQTALGCVFPADSAKLDIFVTLWEGTGDTDDFAVLYVGDTPAYTAQNGVACPFVSAPATGTAFALSFSINKVI